jgi:hypothetical protein
MAAGRTFYPFVKEHPGGRKVMFIDGESTLPELKADLELMMRDWSQSERELVEQNLHVVCDEEINDEPINLSEPEHLAAITEAAREFEPDLIIVDTLSALFTLRDENNNSEIKKVVMQPLKNLAREANAVVWMLHHIGKKNEDGKSTVGAYAGRGGSNIGGLSRVTANLTQDKMDAERVVFELTKAKGFRLKPVLMQLNHDSRWFVPLNEKPEPKMTNYELIVSTVKNFGRWVRRKEVDAALDGKLSTPRITEYLAQAETRNDLIKPKYGYYCAPEIANAEEVKI